MRVLALNCGSSTLKFDVIEVDATNAERTAGGLVDRIGRDANISFRGTSGELEKPVEASGHAQAFSRAAEVLESAGLSKGLDAVGHRVVHGGLSFRSSAVIDDSVIRGIEAVSELAPLHNDRALSVIEAARERWPHLPMVAAFDTTFFAGLPSAAAQYALPGELAARLGIRRFGFHGLAHAYMVARYRELRPGRGQRVVTLQLGNGCSAAASVDGAPIDTSMGMTPLEGLIMGTRSGDLDPAIPLLLETRGRMSPAEVEELLNTRSGLLGLSGQFSDMRDVISAAESGDEASALAVEAFCRRIVKYVGGYMALMSGADALIFGGGIGENSAEVRRRVASSFLWAGLDLDEAANRDTGAAETLISRQGSTVEAWVFRVDEAVAIALETARTVMRQTDGRRWAT